MAATAVPMYGMKPYCASVVPELPTTMYSMRSHYSSSSSADMESLIQRQAHILKDLENLQQEVKGLASQIGVKLAARSKLCPTMEDYVIAASPAEPPMMAISIEHYLHRRGTKHSTAIFVHSSVKQPVSNHLKSCLAATRPDNSRDGPLMVSLVWKQTDQPYLVQSSISHVPLSGEFVIARHLCRTVAPELYGKLTPEHAACADQWLDIGKSLITGTSKEKAAALRNLNSKLGACKWLVNNNITLADIAVACCVVKTKAIGTAPDNVKKWVKTIPGLEQFI